MKSGHILWDEISLSYQTGVNSVREAKKNWSTLKNDVDTDRFNMVADFLIIQEKEAVWWKDACLSYFQTYSHLPIPASVEKPLHPLEYYEKLSFPYAPGIRPQW